MSGTAWWGEGERTGVSHRRDWGFDPLRLAVRRRTLGDRACISQAMKTSLPAFTAEGEWVKCNLAVEVMKIS